MVSKVSEVWTMCPASSGGAGRVGAARPVRPGAPVPGVRGYGPRVERGPGALGAVGHPDPPRHPLLLVLVKDVLDERLLLAHRVLVRHQAPGGEPAGAFLGAGEPLLVLEVDPHDYLLDAKDRLHGLEEL